MIRRISKFPLAPAALLTMLALSAQDEWSARGEECPPTSSSAVTAPADGILVAARPRIFSRLRFRAAPRTAPQPAATGGVNTAQQPQPTPAKTPTAQASQWKSLFDGKTLDGWKSTEFGGEGEVTVEDGVIQLALGQPLSGITYTKKDDLPKTNFEIRVEARKTAGSDFFCGLTFPVADSYASFIVGGWGGGLVGISSIDGNDAANNDTSTYHSFKEKQWYKLRVRVLPENISAWIDDDQVVDRDIKGHKISTRSEVDLSRPLGISNYETKAEIRKIEIRRLDAK